jgi:hypothetical protein
MIGGKRCDEDLRFRLSKYYRSPRPTIPYHYFLTDGMGSYYLLFFHSPLVGLKRACCLEHEALRVFLRV